MIARSPVWDEGGRGSVLGESIRVINTRQLGCAHHAGRVRRAHVDRPGRVGWGMEARSLVAFPVRHPGAAVAVVVANLVFDVPDVEAVDHEHHFPLFAPIGILLVTAPHQVRYLGRERGWGGGGFKFKLLIPK